MTGRVYRINIKVQTPGERGIPKTPIDSVYVQREGMVGDYNRSRSEKKKGDLDKAVVLLPMEMLELIRAEGWPVEPGHLGENITTLGVAYDFFTVGDLYVLGNAKIEITRPCTPCINLSSLPYVGEERIREFMKTLLDRRGWCAKVISPGMVSKGDGIEKIFRKEITDTL